MRGMWLGLGLAFGLAGSAVGAASAADLAAYGRLPSIEDAALSPDGKRVALMKTDGEMRQVYVYDLAARKITAVLDAGAQKARYIKWADPDDLIVVVTKTTNMLAQGIQASASDYAVGMVWNVATRKQEPLIGGSFASPQGLNIVIGSPQIRADNGQPVAYVTGVYFDQGEGVRSIYRTTMGGQTRLAFEGRTDTEDFLVDDKGNVFAESTFEDRSGKEGLLIRGQRGLREVALPADFQRDIDLVGFNQSGDAALVRYDNGKRVVAAEVSAEGAWTPRPDLTGKGAIMDPQTNRLLGTVSEDKDDNLDYGFSTPADQQAWKAIAAAYPGQRVTLQGLSADHKVLLILCDSPTDGQAYAIVDLKTGQADYIGNVYSGLKPDDISPVQPVHYKAADGLEISGYLTLPKKAGKDAKALPLAVLVHGGPADSDDAGFDWWSQALAAQGYAVLRANYRGSTNQGQAFMTAGFGEWGKKMQTDLSDGVRYLAKQGTIDPKRVCIVGASYGGYAALVGATLDPGVYRCAAAIAGPADLKTILVSDRNNKGYSALRYWDQFMGVSGPNDPALAKISPVEHVDAVTIPILLVHGKDDTVVLYKQSQIMADALKRAGKPYEFVTLDSEDHWLSRGATRLQMLQSVTAFLQKNNPAQ